jgi:hypothetical protein
MFEVMTPALSIRQPWASLIILAGKDIENRSWPAYRRGPILIHAAKGMTWDDYLGGLSFAYRIDPKLVEALGVLTVSASMGFIVDESKQHITRIDLAYGLRDCPLPRGGIIGSVNLVDCVRQSTSPWFVGPNGFVMRDPRPLPFVPFKGERGFFEIPWGQL